MRIHVLGVGSIGSLFSFHLRQTLPRDIPISLIIRQREAGTAPQPSPDASRITVTRNDITETAEGFEPEVFRMSNEMIFGLAYGVQGQRRVATPSAPDLATDEYTPPKYAEPFRPRGEGASRNPHAIDSLIIACKASSTLPGIQRILPRINRNSTIVLLQNGMGVYDSLVERLFSDPARRPHFVLATTTHGVWTKSSMDVVHAGMGDFHFGIVPDPTGRRNYEAAYETTGTLALSDISRNPTSDPEFRTLYETIQALSALRSLRPTWEPIQHLHIRLLKKLTVNCCVNPLTALMDVSNGELMGLPSAYKIMQSVCEEASAAFRAQAQATLDALAPGEHPSMLGAGAMDAIAVGRQLTAKKLEQETMRVVGVTAKNYSSMLQDIKNGRMTEIDHMNGYMVGLGQRYGVPMPVNNVMYHLIRMRHALGWATELPGVMRWWEPMGAWRKPPRRKQTVLSTRRPDGRRGSPL